MRATRAATLATSAGALEPVDALSAARRRWPTALLGVGTWWAAALAVPVLTAIAVGLALGSHHVAHPRASAADHAALVAVPMLVGLAWWRRRPASAYGPLLVLLGLTALPLAFLSSDVPVAFALALLGNGAFYWLYLYACVAFPAGRLSGRGHRCLAATFAVATLLVVPAVLFSPVLQASISPLDRCVPECPPNPLYIAALSGVVEASVNLAFLLALVATVGLGACTVGRLRSASPLQRRELAVIAAAGFPFFVALTLVCALRLVHAPEATQQALSWTREREVLAQMAQGKSNAAIADELVLTKRAVEKHVGAIFLRLGLADEEVVSRRVAAVLVYLAEADADPTR